MNDSNKKSANRKPGKPYPDFPLFPHATRRWAKKILAKTHYFGPWDDPDGSLKKFLDERDDLYAGRTSRISEGETKIRDLLNRFLTAKQHLLETGEIAERRAVTTMTLVKNFSFLRSQPYSGRYPH